jgi:Uma2 family endonuclease
MIPLATASVIAMSDNMSAALKLNLISIEDYLAGELVSPIKHEYLGGAVYAMAGARNSHNRIKGNILASLHLKLRGKRCEVWDSDTKIRIHLPNEVRFYYPDDSVVCDQIPRVIRFKIVRLSFSKSFRKKRAASMREKRRTPTSPFPR